MRDQDLQCAACLAITTRAANEAFAQGPRYARDGLRRKSQAFYVETGGGFVVMPRRLEKPSFSRNAVPDGIQDGLLYRAHKASS
jgi:hypothetical protein